MVPISSKMLHIHVCICVHCCCLVARLCPIFCDPMDCSLPRLLCLWGSPGKNTGIGCYALLQSICPTQGLNPRLLCLLHWQVDSLPLVPLLTAYIICAILKKLSIKFILKSSLGYTKKRLKCVYLIQSGTDPVVVFHVY